jgi:hypothetical protein
LPPYHETIEDNLIASTDSFHSIVDSGERDGNQYTQDDILFSNSIVFEYNKNILLFWMNFM